MDRIQSQSYGPIRRRINGIRARLAALLQPASTAVVTGEVKPVVEHQVLVSYNYGLKRHMNSAEAIWNAGDGTIVTPWVVSDAEHVDALRATICDLLIQQGQGSYDCPPKVVIINVTQLK